jgi:altronate dehydratase
VLDYTVLEGHRFALAPIAPGEALLSWGLPFGTASRSIEPGNYVCNDGMLQALRGRSLDLTLPSEANFDDRIKPFVLHEVKPAEPLERYRDTRTFTGYPRTGARGVGTRNYIVLLGTTSRTNSYVRELEVRLKGAADPYDRIDGIVAVAHTEGGTDATPNNLDLLLRTLAGFMTHPNVGAVLAVDDGTGAVTNVHLRSYMLEHGYPLDSVTHRFMTLKGSFGSSLRQGEAVVRGWLEQVNSSERSEQPVSNLKVALQCGGSDAFSGISGNPLAAWVARELIKYGGAANLAETDELIGAEAYVLDRVKDRETAEQFLRTVERFKERVGWHGTTAEGNPSGGNKLRGLYNIALKSIGAAMKRHPEVPLDGVLAYGEQMPDSGYYFMDSPGNDLESIAGQVASGCNLIFFITGNGSVTNFPFVPTIKIVTTTERYNLLKHDMDVNAGAYLDGTPMDDLGAELFELTLGVASGARTAGERAGHAQVQLWRDWRQTDARELERLLQDHTPVGEPLPIRTEHASEAWQFRAVRSRHGHSTDQLGLVLPTSLCAGQIARMTTDSLNAQRLGRYQGVSRFVTLVHTEGCGVSGGSTEAIYARTMLGYLTHPMVSHCLLLEHGCEKTHNDFMRQQLAEAGVGADTLGWASIQQDGGIERVMEKIGTWFRSATEGTTAPEYEVVGLEAIRLGVGGTVSVPDEVARSIARMIRMIVGAGGTVVLAQNAAVLAHPAFRAGTLDGVSVRPTLAYGQKPAAPGFHIMETPTDHWVETLTGLGATGVESIMTYVSEHSVQGHPFIPVMQVTSEEALAAQYADDLDLVLQGGQAQWTDHLLRRLLAMAAGEYTPRLYGQGKTDFQLTRGLLGVSL